MSRTVDVVIVGGGVTGCSLAFHLASLDAGRILVLERAFLGAGATGRSVGIIRQLYPTPETTSMVLASLSVYQRFAEAVGGRSGYVGCGCLVGVSPAMRGRLEDAVARQRALGVKAEIVAAEDVQRLEPRIDPAGLGAALYEPDSGYADPAAVTAGYADAARRLGVRFEQGVEVTGIRQQGGRVTGVVTSTGEEIGAGAVVNAAGLWSRNLASLAGVELPIVVGRHPVFVLERPAGFGAPHMVYLDLAGGSYVRPETGDLTLTGSLTDDESRHPMDPELLGSEAGFEEAASVLAVTAAAVPALADARFARGYAGAFDITPDWMPILDESPLRGFFIAAGLSGHGFKLAPAIGETMARLVAGRTPAIDPTPFRLDRFASSRASGTFVSSYLG